MQDALSAIMLMELHANNVELDVPSAQKLTLVKSAILDSTAILEIAMSTVVETQLMLLMELLPTLTVLAVLHVILLAQHAFSTHLNV